MECLLLSSGQCVELQHYYTFVANKLCYYTQTMSMSLSGREAKMILYVDDWSAHLYSVSL